MQTPETSLKGTEEEFQEKVETTKTAASTEKTGTERKGRSQPTAELCGKAEWEDETESVRSFYPFDIQLRLLRAFSFEVDFRPTTLATWNATTRQRDNKQAKLSDDRDVQFKLPGCVFPPESTSFC